MNKWGVTAPFLESKFWSLSGWPFTSALCVVFTLNQLFLPNDIISKTLHSVFILILRPKDTNYVVTD